MTLQAQAHGRNPGRSGTTTPNTVSIPATSASTTSLLVLSGVLRRLLLILFLPFLPSGGLLRPAVLPTTTAQVRTYVVTLSLHCCYTAVTLLLHYRCTIDTLLTPY
jgi:hypothetical protein